MLKPETLLRWCWRIPHVFFFFLQINDDIEFQGKPWYFHRKSDILSLKSFVLWHLTYLLMLLNFFSLVEISRKTFKTVSVWFMLYIMFFCFFFLSIKVLFSLNGMSYKVIKKNVLWMLLHLKIQRKLILTFFITIYHFFSLKPYYNVHKNNYFFSSS